MNYYGVPGGITNNALLLERQQGTLKQLDKISVSQLAGFRQFK